MVTMVIMMGSWGEDVMVNSVSLIEYLLLMIKSMVL